MDKKLFINLTNHPSATWAAEQYAAAAAVGTVIDIPFPEIQPEATKASVADVAVGKMADILNIARDHETDFSNVTIHVMGELTFCIAFTRLAKTIGLRCVCSTTKRDSVEVVNKDGTTTKKSVFSFVQFREL